MAWENRGNGRYYYSKERVDGRVKSTYWGGGELASAVSAMEAQRQAEEKFKRDQWEAERQAQKEIDQAIDKAGAMVRLLIRAVMLDTGHYQHRRQWRRRQDESNPKP